MLQKANTNCPLLIGVMALSALFFPGAAEAQRSGAPSHIEGRFNDLQRTITQLSAQLEQLNAQDRRLQKQLGDLQTKLGQRLERLEKGTAPKPVPHPSHPKRTGK